MTMRSVNANIPTPTRAAPVLLRPPLLAVNICCNAACFPDNCMQSSWQWQTWNPAQGALNTVSPAVVTCYGIINGQQEARYFTR